jgi:phospholipase C
VAKSESAVQKSGIKKLLEGIYGSSLLCLILTSALASCAGIPQSFVSQPSTVAARDLDNGARPSTPIQHIVIIVQENRTPDDIFQGVPGADIAKTAVDSRGDIVPLHAVSLASYGLGHSHAAFVRDYDNGKMDGFDKQLPPGHHLRPYGYAPRSEVKPYYDMATQYVFADHMFQSNQGPSFPAHLYIVSGTATERSISSYRVSGNSYDSRTLDRFAPGCDAQKSTVVPTINPTDGSRGPRRFPCFDRPVLPDLLDARGVSWHYYQYSSGAGLWHAFDAIRHVRYGPGYANVINPPQTILTDIAKDRLAGVSWVMPDAAHSDHAGAYSTAKGPSWVAAVVNAVGTSKYWKHTAIFVTWDDWGGWYDHVRPPMYDHYELGFRVPLIVISPYSKRGYVSKVTHEFGSILAFSEESFGIRKGALDSTDKRSDDLMDAFNFSQKPRAFVPIKAPPFHPAVGPNIEDP